MHPHRGAHPAVVPDQVGMRVRPVGVPHSFSSRIVLASVAAGMETDMSWWTALQVGDIHWDGDAALELARHRLLCEAVDGAAAAHAD